MRACNWRTFINHSAEAEYAEPGFYSTVLPPSPYYPSPQTGSINVSLTGNLILITLTITDEAWLRSLSMTLRDFPAVALSLDHQPPVTQRFINTRGLTANLPPRTWCLICVIHWPSVVLRAMHLYTWIIRCVLHCPVICDHMLILDGAPLTLEHMLLLLLVYLNSLCNRFQAST